MSINEIETIMTEPINIANCTLLTNEALSLPPHTQSTFSLEASIKDQNIDCVPVFQGMGSFNIIYFVTEKPFQKLFQPGGKISAAVEFDFTGIPPEKNTCNVSISKEDLISELPSARERCFEKVIQYRKSNIISGGYRSCQVVETYEDSFLGGSWNISYELYCSQNYSILNYDYVP